MSFKEKNNLDKINFIKHMQSEDQIGDDFIDLKKFLLKKLPAHTELKVTNNFELWELIQHLQNTHCDFLKDEYFKSESARKKFILKYADPSQKISLLGLPSEIKDKDWKKLIQVVGTDDAETFQEIERLKKLYKTEFED